MPISEKDIFRSLMQDPNHAYNGLEKVWAEAQQRARQFRNNEKALALALEKSALENFSDYLTKAQTRTALENFKIVFERQRNHATANDPSPARKRTMMSALTAAINAGEDGLIDYLQEIQDQYLDVLNNFEITEEVKANLPPPPEPNNLFYKHLTP